MRYYIADLHFFHENLNGAMDNRGFSTKEEMNEYMISQWNKKVRTGDEVMILGDFSVGKASDTTAVLERLNGRKYLIKGNHDKFLDDKKFDVNKFVWIKDYYEGKDNKRKVILSHYPIFCYNGQYRIDTKIGPKTFMLYGHVHDTYDEKLVNEFISLTKEQKREVKGYDEPINIPCQMINTFCMFSDYMPLTLDEWIEVDKKRRENLCHTFTKK